MAEAAVFETGKLTDIWSQVGRDAGGAPRFRRANFDILLWAAASGVVAEYYVVPLGLERSNSADIALKPDGTGQIGQEFGYYSGDSMFLDPSQGDGSDTIQGLHSFGYV